MRGSSTINELQPHRARFTLEGLCTKEFIERLIANAA